MRDPGLHITKSKLIELMKEWDAMLLDDNFDGKDSVYDEVNYIMKRGSNSSLLNRSILDPKKDTQIKSLTRLSSTKMDDATLFNNLLSDVRVQMKHRGFVRIKKFDSDWPFIVEMAKLGLEFANAFNMERRTGFIQYIKNYFSIRPGQFRLRQMKSFHESIIARQQVIEEIENYSDQDEAYRGYKSYRELVFNKTGIDPKYNKENNPEKYVYFVRVAIIAKELGIDVEDYMVGQFESLDWTGGFPSPEQLITVNARDRVLKWMSENKMTVSKVKNLDEDEAILKFRALKAKRKKWK